MEENRPAKIEFKEWILDSVHGYIGITEAEKKIIDLPLFRRLQKIKHLSLVNLIFPGAEHTRYTHSLGVMHLADQVALTIGLDVDARRLLRLAGLLHDIGHYPLSHVGETVYQNYLEHKDFVLAHHKHDKAMFEEIIGVQPDHGVNVQKYHHEKIGATIIANYKALHQILDIYYSDLGGKNLLTPKIGYIITGTYPNDYPDIHPLIQIIHSELDVDRMDYLLRDSTFCGTGFGGAEVGKLVRHIQLSGDGRYIGIDSRGISAADQFLINRFFANTQILANRDVASLEYMAEAVLWYATLKGGYGLLKPDEFDEACRRPDLPGNERNLMAYTDLAFWNAVQLIVEKSDQIQKEPDELFSDENRRCIPAFAEKLLYHKSLKAVDHSTQTRCQMKASDTYALIAETSEHKAFEANLNGAEFPGKITMMHTNSVTKLLVWEDYKKTLPELHPAMRPEKRAEAKETIATSMEKRLREGILVIGYMGNIDPILLVDAPNSLMHTLYSMRHVVIRQYDFPGMEPEPTIEPSTHETPAPPAH
ncbi:MAG: HD domain-containing protein [Oscillospiraceae bacterium]|jgi:putative nucleotidyltransferase with HDIG domain|nr:HD domain-containing protein [Oscillospiraceae bacterium]